MNERRIPMETATTLPRRSLGKTGLSVTPLGLSAFSMRAAGPKGLALAPEDIERAYYEFGINTFLVHGRMKSLVRGIQTLIRSGKRDDLVLVAGTGIPIGRSIRRAVGNLCNLLETDTIDVFLVAWAKARWYLNRGVRNTLRQLKEEGRVRAVGISSHNRRLAAQLAREHDLDVLMIRYNAAHRGAEKEVFEALGDKRPAIISYTATRWGILLQPLPKRGFPSGLPAGDCYRFVLSHPSVDVALCAARTPQEIREDVEAVLQGPLSPERMEEIRRFGDLVHQEARGGARWAFR
jgi:aryl-alcohol dehydrogenase-like predicted oxidoreductase